MDRQYQALVKTKNKAAKSTPNLSAPLDPTRHTVVSLEENAQRTSKPSPSDIDIGNNNIQEGRGGEVYMLGDQVTLLTW